MSETNSPPLYDFANKDSLTGLLRVSYQKLLQNTDDMMPAKIISYNRTTNLATVQPQIKIVTTNNLLVSRAQSVSVPVFTLGGGGLFLSFPLKANDLGWIKATDRDISLYLQSMNESPPNTGRVHSFDNGLFFPDVMNQMTISEGDAGNLVIGSFDGSTKISIGNGSIAFTSTTLTHNGVNIGATHGHNYIPGTSGEAKTGVPE